MKFIKINRPVRRAKETANMKFKITTKDEQWTMAENMTEEETVKFWNNKYSGTTAVLDYIILGDDGCQYEETEGMLKKHHLEI